MVNLLDGATNQPSKLEQEIGLKSLMNQKKDMIIVTLDLKQSQWGQVYLIRAIYAFLLKKL